jgi:hypothetical protein
MPISFLYVGVGKRLAACDPRHGLTNRRVTFPELNDHAIHLRPLDDLHERGCDIVPGDAAVGNGDIASSISSAACVSEASSFSSFCSGRSSRVNPAARSQETTGWSAVFVEWGEPYRLSEV